MREKGAEIAVFFLYITTPSVRLRQKIKQFPKSPTIRFQYPEYMHLLTLSYYPFGNFKSSLVRKLLWLWSLSRNQFTLQKLLCKTRKVFFVLFYSVTNVIAETQGQDIHGHRTINLAKAIWYIFKSEGKKCRQFSATLWCNMKDPYTLSFWLASSSSF